MVHRFCLLTALPFATARRKRIRLGSFPQGGAQRTHAHPAAVEEEKRLRKVILKRLPKQLPEFDKVRRQPADPSGMRHDSLLKASPSSKVLKDSSDEY